MSGSQTSQVGLGSDREDLAFLILHGDAAYGARATLGSVIAVIEHGGNPAGADCASRVHDEMITRIGGNFDVSKRKSQIKKLKRLTARWRLISVPRQRVLVVHYNRLQLPCDQPSDADVLKGRATRAIHDAFGELHAVALELHYEAMCAKAARAGQAERNAAADELEALYAELGEWPQRRERAAAVGGPAQARFRARSALWFASAVLRPLDSRIGELVAAYGAQTAQPTRLDALESLDNACRGGKGASVPELKEKAASALRDAHDAWDATWFEEADRERKRTKREARTDATNAWLEKEGLA